MNVAVLNAYANIARQGGKDAIALRQAADGTESPFKVGKLGGRSVKVITTKMPDGKDRVVEHFRTAMSRAYGSVLGKDALLKSGIDGGKKPGPLTGDKVRQAMQFAASVKKGETDGRKGMVEGTVEGYIVAISGTPEPQLQAKMPDVNLGQLTPHGVAYIRHHFTQALLHSNFAMEGMNSKADIEETFIEVATHAARMDGNNVAAESLGLSLKMGAAMGSVVEGIKNFDTNAVLRSGGAASRHQQALGGLEDPNSRGFGTPEGYVGSVPSPRREAARILAQTPPAERGLLSRNTDLMLEAMQSVAGQRNDVIGLDGAKDVLTALKAELDGGMPSATASRLNVEDFSGLADATDFMDAVTSFGGRVEGLPIYGETNNKVYAEVTQFMKSPPRVGKKLPPLSPIFQRLLEPTEPEDVRSGLKILKRYMDDRIVGVSLSLDQAASTWRTYGESVNKRMDELSSGPTPKRYPEARAIAETESAPLLQRGDDLWQQGMEPINRGRLRMIDIATIMGRQKNPLAQEGGKQLTQLLEFYPWRGAHMPREPTINTGIALLGMPRELQMAPDAAKPLGASWQIHSAALSGSYIGHRAAGLEKLMTDAAPQSINVGGREIAVDQQFFVDAIRQDIRLVIDGKAEPLIPEGATSSQQELETVVSAVADYIGDPQDLLAITSLMSQAMIADTLQTYNSKHSMSPLVTSSAEVKLTTMTRRVPTDASSRVKLQLEKVDADNYKITWNSPAYVSMIGVDSGSTARDSNSSAVNTASADSPSLAREEEITLHRSADGWQVSLPVEQIEFKVPIEDSLNPAFS